VYLHELDTYMERYTALSKKEKADRRRHGQANVVYIRYADDFCVLMNGHKEEAEQMREELTTFLRETLHLTLSQEKTKITHLNDGFRFLGFEVQRKPGHDGMKSKILLRIPDTAVKHVLDKLAHCCGTEGSVQAKIHAMTASCAAGVSITNMPVEPVPSFTK
jgi:RNA-directed DNA polymerase